MKITESVREKEINNIEKHRIAWKFVCKEVRWHVRGKNIIFYDKHYVILCCEYTKFELLYFSWSFSHFNYNLQAPTNSNILQTEKHFLKAFSQCSLVLYLRKEGQAFKLMRDDFLIKHKFVNLLHFCIFPFLENWRTFFNKEHKTENQKICIVNIYKNDKNRISWKR